MPYSSKKKTNNYRKYNYLASETRTNGGFTLHPDLLHGLKKIAKQERKSVSWLVETALSDYFGVEVMFRKLKSKPRPAFLVKDIK